jgi:hypothetical protein
MEDDGVDRDEFPFHDSRAAQMLRTGLLQAAQDRGLSVRGAARELNYKSSVVISHMQNGRVPIPLDRSVEIARVVGLPEDAFCLAVLDQRHPDVIPAITRALSLGHGQDGFYGELQALAGSPLEALPAGHQRILREVVSARNPEGRWLEPPEVPVIQMLRAFRPEMVEHGLSADDFMAIKAVVQH